MRRSAGIPAGNLLFCSGCKHRFVPRDEKGNCVRAGHAWRALGSVKQICPKCKREWNWKEDEMREASIIFPNIALPPWEVEKP